MKRDIAQLQEHTAWKEKNIEELRMQTLRFTNQIEEYEVALQRQKDERNMLLMDLDEKEMSLRQENKKTKAAREELQVAMAENKELDVQVKVLTDKQCQLEQNIKELEATRN